MASSRNLLWPLWAAAAIALWSGSMGAAGAQERQPIIAERLGNPFAQRWPNDIYPRNVWDMAVHEGALYLGAGNSANGGPSPNAGPAPITRFRDGRFERVFLTDDEQVDQFRIIGEHLIVPGHDARESWDFGNLYEFGSGSWQKIRAIPDAIHVYDIADNNGELIAVGGAQRQETDAWVSQDGYTWRPAYLAPNTDLMRQENPSGQFRQVHNGRLYSLFAIGDVMFASGFGLLESSGENGGTQIVATLFSFDRESRLRPEAAAVASGTAAAQRVGVELFPGAIFTQALPLAQVRRAVRLQGTTYYLGAVSHNDHQWIPFGIFAASSLASVRRLDPGGDVLVYDLVVREGQLFALGNRRRVEGGYSVSVLRLNEEEGALSEVFNFEAPTFARSFEMLNGAWYFGLGSETEEPGARQGGGGSPTAVALSEATGEVWRVVLTGANLSATVSTAVQ